MDSELDFVHGGQVFAIAGFHSCVILFQIRDKEKSNGQLREELGGVLEKNKNIMEEVDNRKHVSYSMFFSASFCLLCTLIALVLLVRSQHEMPTSGSSGLT